VTKLEILQKQFGHTSLKTTQKYAKISDESLLDIHRVRMTDVEKIKKIKRK
jgi:site-specific recombinase XerD